MASTRTARLSLLLTAVLLLPGFPARATNPNAAPGGIVADAPADPSLSTSPPLALGPLDAGLVGAAGLLAGFGLLRYYDMSAADPSRLSRGDVNGFDRWAAGNYSAEAALASNLLFYPLAAAPLLLAALDARAAGTGLEPILVEGVILAEAIAFSAGLNLAVRSLRIHARPYLYGSDAPAEDLRSEEASGSFYSGHASGAFLMGTYLAYTYPLRHPEFRHRAWLWAGALGTASTVAGLRVAAGKHFPSDVIVGAAAGALFGWLFPFLHLRPGTDPASGSARAELRLLPVAEGVHAAVVARF